jgi:DNA-binding NarL/FixJ family response regulator
MVKVLFADNHTVVRDGVLRLLANEPRVAVLGDATDFSEAITKARTMKPDVLIVDIYMPFEPHLSLRELSAQLNSCGARVLGMSFANDDEARALATRLGAAELLDKTELSGQLIPAILRVASGSTHFPSPVSAISGERSAV